MDNMITQKIVIICVLILNMAVLDVFAGTEAFYKEFDAVGGYSAQDGWLGKQKGPQRNSVGFEYFRKISSDYGDFLTIDFQARLAYDPHNPFDEAWSMEWHEAWIESKLGLGHNLRVGHFAPAFGLEPVVDTHGTLLQTLAIRDIGFKKDWGIEYRGLLSDFDIFVATTLGSGMGIERKDGSYLVTGRIGSPQTDPFQYGVSFLYGEVLKPLGMSTFPRPKYAENSTRKKRAGLDALYSIGPYTFKGEYALGWDDKRGVMGTMLEVDYVVPSFQKLELELQGQLWANEVGKGNSIDAPITVGATYHITKNLALRVAYTHDIHSFSEEKDDQVYLQLYFFGQ